MRGGFVSKAGSVGALVSGTGSTMDATDLVIVETGSDEIWAEQVGGEGVVVQGGGQANLRQSAVNGALVAGALVLGGQLSLGDVFIAGARAGMIDSGAAGEPAFGDGVLAAGGAVVSVDGCLIDSCARAAIFAHRSSGSVDFTLGTGSAYGLVQEAAASLEVDEASRFFGNAIADRVEDSDLGSPSSQLPEAAPPPAPPVAAPLIVPR